MHRTELQRRQRPLKEQYRAEPDTLLRLTERYCVVLQTITSAPEVSVSRTRAKRT